jgi:hypothetical protein
MAAHATPESSASNMGRSLLVFSFATSTHNHISNASVNVCGYNVVAV